MKNLNLVFYQASLYFKEIAETWGWDVPQRRNVQPTGFWVFSRFCLPFPCRSSGIADAQHCALC